MIKDKRGILRRLIILAVALLLIGFVSLSIAQTSSREDLQSELNSLISELNSQGYSWLINYSLAYPSVEVYRENGVEVIAKFENITTENYYKIYLTSLPEGYSSDVFDLKVLGEVEFDYIVDPIITIPNVAIDATLVNITAEVNFTHLNISTTAPYDNLSLYWPFDSNSSTTTIYDYTKNNKDGTIGGSNYISSGKYGGAMNFPNAGSVATTAAAITPNVASSNFSFGGWIKWYSVGNNAEGYDIPIGQAATGVDSNDFFIQGNSGGPVVDCWFSTDTTGGASITPNVWYHVMCVRDGGNGFLYLNGQYTSSLYNNLNPVVDAPFSIGNVQGSYQFNGSIDEVMAFNKTLTAAEILAIYNNQSSRFATTGTQAFANQSKLNISSGYDTVRVTGDYQALKGSSINLSVGYYAGSWAYTTPQVYTGNNVFAISTSSTNLTLNFTFYAGNSTNPFYSPILSSAVNALTLNVSLNTSVASCGTLSQANTVYTQTANIIPIANAACINITAQNITFNGNGYWIVNSTNDNIGIYSDQINTTIKNVNVSVGSQSTGIRLEGANNSLIQNNTLKNNYYGMYLQSTYNTRVEDITTNTNSADGIYLTLSSNNTFSNIIVTNNSYNGIMLYTDCSNNTFNNIIMDFNGWAEGSASFQIEVGGLNNRISNGNISRSGGTNYPNSGPVYIVGSSTNNTFLNVSYNLSSEYVESGSQLIRKWYYRAYVNDTANNNIGGANVTAFNRTNAYQFNLTTDSTGYTSQTEIIDYVNNGTRTYYSLYNITAFNSSYLFNSHTYNATLQQSNYKDVFTLNLSTNVTSCRTLDQVNTVYTQQANIVQTAEADCIVISAQNITFNGNGYSITSDYNHSGVNSNQYNTTIKNCNINMGSGAFGYGINLGGSGNSYIYNNILSGNNRGINIVENSNNTLTNNTANSNVYDGVYLTDSNNNNLTGNTANSCGGYGIYTGTSNNNLLTDNTANSNSKSGIYLYDSSNNILTSNTANKTSFGDDLLSGGIKISLGYNNTLIRNLVSENYYKGIIIIQSNNNTLTANNVSGHAYSGVSAIYVYQSLNNILTGNILENNRLGLKIEAGNNTIVSNSIISDSVDGVSVYLLSNSVNNTFLNTTYTASQEDVAEGSQLIRKWYYRAYVNDTSNNNMSGVNVTAYNKSSSRQFNLTTGNDGYTNMTEIIDYINNGTARNYYSLHNIYAGNSSWPYLNHTSNVTSQQNNYKDVFTFSQSTIPLSSGWNMIGLTLHDTDISTNRNVALVQGYNLFGYSSSVPVNVSNINFTNSSGWTANWSTAVSQGKAQAYFTYRANNIYRYSATPDLGMHDTALRQNRSYWVQINQVGGGNLSLPSVGGSLVGRSYEWNKLRFSNGTTELNITEADNATYNWIFMSGDSVLYYVDNGIKRTVCGDEFSCTNTTLSSWWGYWIWVNQNNVQLIRRN